MSTAHPEDNGDRETLTLTLLTFSIAYLVAAGYRSRVTGGAGGVSLRAAGEQHAHIAE